jgi:NAD(P)-dependent dehydrogenase (short-subunit alcohol dehydrogenase family)
MTPRRLLLTITEMLGKVDVRAEEAINRRRDRTSTITVRGAIADGLLPPDVSSAITRQLQPIIDKLPAGYSASRHAVEGLSETLDHELRQFGVRVTLVAPRAQASAEDDARSANARRFSVYAINARIDGPGA